MAAASTFNTGLSPLAFVSRSPLNSRLKPGRFFTDKEASMAKDKKKTGNTPAPGDKAVEPAFEPEETIIRSIGLGGMGVEPMCVDIKNGKIIRMRPLHYDDKYTEAELAPARWQIEARGKTYESPKKGLPSHLASPCKKHNRLLQLPCVGVLNLDFKVKFKLESSAYCHPGSTSGDDTRNRLTKHKPGGFNQIPTIFQPFLFAFLFN
jgi:hypothetical protein